MSTTSANQLSVRTFVYRGNAGTLGQRFEEWLELFELTIVLSGITTKEKLLNKGDELLTVFRS